jgi:hypothetical protein
VEGSGGGESERGNEREETRRAADLVSDCTFVLKATEGGLDILSICSKKETAHFLPIL